MNNVVMTIIGLGPRALSVLERLAEHMADGRLRDEFAITIYVLDPGSCGEGAHSSRQPDHLLTNTVASQVSMFPPVSRVGGRGGTSFSEWARRVGYRRFGDRYFKVGLDVGEEIGDRDHLPRRLLGEYLGWVYERIVDTLPPNVRIEHYTRRVVDLIEGDDGAFELVLDNGYRYRSEFVFIATGHGRRTPSDADLQYAEFVKRCSARNPRLDFFASPYPIDSLRRISESAIVAVQGLGLTAYDAISELTIGRGGRFSCENGIASYKKSGREPRLLIFSRSCLPFAARGINQKGISGRHIAQFFTPAAVQAVREKRLALTGDPQLDLSDVMPLIIKEMTYAYRGALQGELSSPERFEPTDEEVSAVRNLVDPLRDKSFSSFAEFDAFFWEMIENDLLEAEKGNLQSGMKAAADVLRDARESLRVMVEYRGLRPSSHREYVERFVATMNRISFGPPKQRNYELLALRDAGLLSVVGGPGSTCVVDDGLGSFKITNVLGAETFEIAADVLIVARLDVFSPRTDASPLTANLHRRGLIRPFINGDYHPSGLDVDEGLHPIRANGTAHTRIWALGYPVEGAHFYTHALPRPLMKSRVTQDADVCVRSLLRVLDQRAETSKRVQGDVAARDSAVFAVR